MGSPENCFRCFSRIFVTAYSTYFSRILARGDIDSVCAEASIWLRDLSRIFVTAFSRYLLMIRSRTPS